MGGLGAALADLVLPRTCAGCGVPGAVLCRRCARLLARPHVATPRRVPAGLPPVVAAGVYAGPVRAAVLAFKERGRAELAGPLGTALALAVAAGAAVLPGRPVLLVPVPPSRASLRSRGRDHVRELAGVAAAELSAAGVAARVAPLLARTGRVRDSAGLSVAERRANLAGTFVPRGGPAVPPGALLVLVDDVLTSGATLTEAAAVLAVTRAEGDTPVLAAAVAATPRAPVPVVTGTVADGAPQRGLRNRLDRLSTPLDSD
ncbi:Predicted amidophosphoribosyltransferases [Geodermatophilus telluris]|uniref:Predicted amidophosphoribosyltransferases n=1 Tax=Geodermatophilus telluris TaxID=1190417 RepID=A0A1G6IFB2_9ACTN|nr:ComF family protein [Geodermatophilus telluris]SDC05161.1 Predicted amidophosphoribosyltransferases [Geodermatophilus telluris]